MSTCQRQTFDSLLRIYNTANNYLFRYLFSLNCQFYGLPTSLRTMPLHYETYIHVRELFRRDPHFHVQASDIFEETQVRKISIRRVITFDYIDTHEFMCTLMFDKADDKIIEFDTLPATGWVMKMMRLRSPKIGSRSRSVSRSGMMTLVISTNGAEAYGE